MQTRLIIAVLSTLVMSLAGTAQAQKSQAPSTSRGAYARPNRDVTPEEKAKLIQAGKEARARRLTIRGRTPFRPGTINLSKSSPLAHGLRGRSFSPISRSATVAHRGEALQGTAAKNLLAAANPRVTKRVVKSGAAGAQTPQPAPHPPQANAGGLPATDAPAPVVDRTAETAAAPVAKPGPAEAKPRFSPAPPLDEWVEYVAKTSERYQFTDSQNARAQAILASLRERARQYRMGRLPEFEAAETIQSPELREDRLGSLNRPIDELFAELKMRLENLPTIAQKLRAEQTPAPK